MNEILNVIDQSVDSFPNLDLVVFTGGEVFLLKDDLINAVAYARKYVKSVRCVSNGYWGKTNRKAYLLMTKLVESGMTELNLSTGIDHQKWVSEDSVVNSAEAAIDHGLKVVIVVEKDTGNSKCYASLIQHPKIVEIFRLNKNQLTIQRNTWIAFRNGKKNRGHCDSIERGGCSQMLTNVVVTPHKKISACCGLTFEYIPELKLGDIRDNSIKTIFEKKFSNFLNIWLSVDGPAKIVDSLFPDDNINAEKGFVHHCESCFFLHNDQTARKRLLVEYKNELPRVIKQFNMQILAPID